MVNLMYQPNKQKHEAKKDACPPGLQKCIFRWSVIDKSNLAGLCPLTTCYFEL